MTSYIKSSLFLSSRRFVSSTHPQFKSFSSCWPLPMRPQHRPHPFYSWTAWKNISQRIPVPRKPPTWLHCFWILLPSLATVLEPMAVVGLLWPLKPRKKQRPMPHIWHYLSGIFLHSAGCSQMQQCLGQHCCLRASLELGKLSPRTEWSVSFLPCGEMKVTPWLAQASKLSPEKKGSSAASP